MIKLRIEGNEKEITLFLKALACVASAERVSRFYPNRGEAARGRVYVDIIDGGRECEQ